MRRELAWGLLLGVWAWTLAGCEEERPPTYLVDAGPRCRDVYEPPETPGDADGDGIPNDEDDDADGDGLDNAFEHQGGHDCAGHDPDGDGIASWLDRDSDGDGLSDAKEQEAGSNAYDVDSDGDGWTDLIEIGLGTSARDATSRPSEGWEVITLDAGEERTLDVRFVNEVEIADVFFLVDTTGSMGEERRNLIDQLTGVIVPGIEEAFRDVHFGAAGFDDYPVGDFGSSGDLPFYLLTPMIPGDEDSGSWGSGRIAGGMNGRADILDAIEALGQHSGSDLPEAFVPALHATATGEGLEWPGGSVAAQDGCATTTFGYPCFREEAFPIVLLIGDAPFHNGPDDAEPYGSAVPEAPTYDATVAALTSAGIRVVGVYSGPADGSGRDHFEQVAEDTLGVDTAGAPLLFQLPEDGSGLDTTVVTAIRQLAAGRMQDVTVVATGTERDGFDPATLVTSIEAVEGRTGGSPGGYASRDGATFRQVEPGVELEYRVVLRNERTDLYEPEAHALALRATGDGGATFAIRRFAVILTPDDWTVTTDP